MREHADVVPAARITDVLLAADELVTQALLAADRANDEGLTFEIAADRHEVTLAVEDHAVEERPRSPLAGNDDTGTLGLVIVSEVADRWGMETRGPVTRTWTTFAVPAA